jgi:hypothetical protein
MTISQFVALISIILIICNNYFIIKNQFYIFVFIIMQFVNEKNEQYSGNLFSSNEDPRMVKCGGKRRSKKYKKRQSRKSKVNKKRRATQKRRKHTRK